MSLSIISVPIATKTFLALAAALKDRNSGQDPIDAINDAVESLIETIRRAPLALPTVGQISPKPAIRDGYWWKQLFVPSGTKARMSYRYQSFEAEVSSRGISYDEKFFSPSEWVNYITKTNRNAWRDIEFQFAGSEAWALADNLRRQPG
jgi:hypothetical protein